MCACVCPVKIKIACIILRSSSPLATAHSKLHKHLLMIYLPKTATNLSLTQCTWLAHSGTGWSPWRDRVQLVTLMRSSEGPRIRLRSNTHILLNTATRASATFSITLTDCQQLEPYRLCVIQYVCRHYFKTTPCARCWERAHIPSSIFTYYNRIATQCI